MRKAFSQKLGLDPLLLTKPRQTHSSDVSVVTQRPYGGAVRKVDGLVSKDLPLCVIGADCAQVLAIDPVGVIGVAHAGWKGTLGGIAKNLVHTMVGEGARIKDICVAIGPRIGLTCYPVSLERANLFRKRFGENSGVTQKIGDNWHIDLGLAILRELQDAGIQKRHIDLLEYCTSCNNDRFFSFRKNYGKAKYGETAGMIGFWGYK
ncbi:MAG TPA: polyphenol oxidase family protein [Patescibacteria group bacterium]|nr:polyphenol oxidase family protein [Patescibacteria group bacterium]